MGKRGWWLLGSAALLLLPVAAAGVVVARFDPNSLKPTLAAAARNATGRNLVIRGDIRISRSLWPTLEADGVTLANLPGGSRPDMARAERIAIELALPALLRHRIEVRQLTLTGPDILFEQVKGVPNWRFELPDTDAGPAPAPAPTPAFTLDIRNAHIRNGMVTWRLPARTKVLGIRDMEVAHHSDGGPIEFGGTFVYADNQPFRLSGSALPTAGIADPWTTRLDLSAFDTVASATGTMDTAGLYDLQVEATSGSLDKLNALLPEMNLPAVHRVALSARIGNGRQPGDLPVIGATRLRFADADLGRLVPGLVLGGFEVALDKPGGLASVKGGGRYGKQGFTLGGSFGVPPHPDDRVAVPLDLVLQSVAGASGRLGLKGTLALRSLVFAGLDATASVATPALAAWRPLVSDALPALTGLQLDSHFVLPADARSVVFSGARLVSKQGDLAGDGTLGLGGASLALKARLHAAALDLGAMLAAFGIDLSPPGPSAAGGTVIPDTPLPWAVLRGPALDVSARAEALQFGGETWHGVDLGLLLRDGHLQRGSVSVLSGGNPVTVTVSADARQARVPVSLTIDAPALPLALVARYAELPGRVTGSARVEARVDAAGRSLHELAGSLNGTASLAAVGGTLSNAAFVALTRASLAALGVTVPAQGDTALRCLGVAAAFRAGVGRLDPIALETTYLSLGGEGQVDLGRETVSLQLKPLATVSGSKVEVPVVVEGPFRAIAGRLDASLLDKLGLLVDAWFGGDEATACVEAGLIAKPGR